MLPLFYYLQVAYAIGVAEPLSITVFDYGTSHKTQQQLLAIVKKNFDLRPGKIVKWVVLSFFFMLYSEIILLQTVHSNFTFSYKVGLLELWCIYNWKNKDTSENNLYIVCDQLISATPLA